MIKDFSISFSRVIIFWNCNFYVCKPTFSVNRDLKQHDAVMKRRSLEEWLFNCSHASLITDPIWTGICEWPPPPHHRVVLLKVSNFCCMKRLRVSNQFNSLFILYISTAKPFSLAGVYWNEDKQTRNLVIFDPANFEMTKTYQGNFSVLTPFGTVIFYYLKSLKKIFTSSENAIWSNSLKYQEIDVQMQKLTDKIETSYIVAFFERSVTANL